MAIKIQFRRNTASYWTVHNPTLAVGEPVFETNSGKFKIGDGTTAWVSLPYAGGDAAGALLAALNLSDLANAATARTNLGLGDAATHPASDFDAAGAAATVQGNLTAHVGDGNNPHETTKDQVGLGSCDNTSDADKPVSTAQQTALNLKQDIINFAENETPAGTIDGANAVFTMGFVPVVASVKLYKNGLRQEVVTDFNRTGNTITFVAGNIPDVGDILLVDYRY